MLKIRKPIEILDRGREEVLQRAAWDQGFFWGGAFVFVVMSLTWMLLGR